MLLILNVIENVSVPMLMANYDLLRPDLVTPNSIERMNRTMKTMKRIFAMPAAPAAMPPKPKTAATMAMTKKTAAQYNMPLTPDFLINH